MINFVHRFYKISIIITHVLFMVSLVVGGLVIIGVTMNNTNGPTSMVYGGLGLIVLVPVGILGSVLVYSLVIGFINWTLVVANKLDETIHLLDQRNRKMTVGESERPTGGLFVDVDDRR